VYNANESAATDAALAEIVRKYRQSAAKRANWIESNLAESQTVFILPESHRRLLRTSNSLERINKEFRRRTLGASLFPSEASCLRLVTAVLMEISDERKREMSIFPLLRTTFENPYEMRSIYRETVALSLALVPNNMFAKRFVIFEGQYIRSAMTFQTRPAIKLYST
jgi:transposase-like protein